VRQDFVNFGKYVVDFFQTGRLTPEALNAVITVEHIEYLRQCRDLKKGIIGLTAHVGNWELGTGVLVANGCKVNAIVRAQPSARLDALFQAQRIRRGIRALSMDHAAASASACLKRDELVVLLGDLDFSSGGRVVPFFGKPARLPWGPAVLAKRSGAPILPAFVLRQADDTFCFRAYPPILPERSQSVEDIQMRVCAVLEEVIGDHPDQWFAFQPLWS
jgi:KDO2-lipid IV(A) lauroyltransferase